MSLVPLYPALSGLAICLLLVPLSWHLKARNSGTLIYIFWGLVGNLVFLTNTIVWAGNFEDHAPTWCDISAKLIVGLSVGLTAASLCINRNLYKVATATTVAITSSKLKAAAIDLMLGIGLPMVVMALDCVVAGRRYGIIEDIGCWPATQNTLLAIPMILIWPIIISVASLIYCSLSIRAFLIKRQQVSQLLNSSHSGINTSRYFRLMALASIEIAFSLPLALYFLVTNLRGGTVVPWVSWEDTHSNFSEPVKFPMILLKSVPDVYKGLLINLWVMPSTGFVFFLFFGLSEEAIVVYKSMFHKFLAIFGVQPKSKPLAPNPTWRNPKPPMVAHLNRARSSFSHDSALEKPERKTNIDLEAGDS